MSPERAIAFFGAACMVGAALADPINVRTTAVTAEQEAGMYVGTDVAITTVAPVNGAEAMMAVGTPGFRMQEYDTEADPPVQPDPEVCYEDHPRVVNMLGLWPEPFVTIRSFDGTEWTDVQVIDTPYTGQTGFGIQWGGSLTFSPDGEFLLIGSTTVPGLGGQYLYGLDCEPDVASLPGGFIPLGHLDLYQWDGAQYAPVADGSFTGPLSGQPTARCACIDDIAQAAFQNGIGHCTDMLTFSQGLNTSTLIISGMPWYDGYGAYPVFTGIEDTTVDPPQTFLFPGEDATGLCCTETDSVPDMTSEDCGLLGGVLLSDEDGLITDAGGCTAPMACCVNEECAADMLAIDCVMAFGVPSPGSCLSEEDEPCPNDAITMAQIPEGQFSDPTACGRGGAFVAVLDNNTGTFTRLQSAVNTDGDILTNSGTYDEGIFGLLPDPLAIDGEPFSQQLAGWAVAVTQADNGTIWLAMGAPQAGGVTGAQAIGVDPDCSAAFLPDVTLGPLQGRVLLYTFDPTTNVATHVQTLTASDGLNFHGFGSSLKFDGDRLLVGAPNWDSPTEAGGAVYIFDRNQVADAWVQTYRLTPENPSNSARFGWDFDIFDEKIVVGAPMQDTADGGQTGAAHRFNFNDDINDWEETEVLLSPVLGDQLSLNYGNQQFGKSVAINDTVVYTGGPELVRAMINPFTGELMLTVTGGIGTTDSRPLPDGVAAACEGDFDDNGEVNVGDLIHMLRGMSRPSLYPECDMNDDALINGVDLIEVINCWGECG